MCATNAVVIAAVAEAESANQTRRRGSRSVRALNEEQFREERGKNMMEDYFVERPVFNDEEFRTCYRMSHNVFNRISGDLCRYDQWATFVKSIPRPTRPKDLKFFQAQEGYMKDVERCFGILQSRFSIVRGAARGWDIKDLRYIMLTCIILHNMIVEDERPEDSDEDLESDEEKDNNMRPRLATVWEGPTGDDFDSVGRDGHNFNRFMDRYDAIRCEYTHSNLQEDLIEHLCNIQGNLQI
ncbi:uncharacterized protein LOC133729184 [Rosa rugosa]|uniref:uncharacterized protein LOC133729184 n=1 Tax=Rosa rugosa TaxID=74645 RepID=UPI002B4062B0|nr:uncharacterized protein LOC133729184 [Rosa rugosa]